MTYLKAIINRIIFIYNKWGTMNLVQVDFLPSIVKIGIKTNTKYYRDDSMGNAPSIVTI